MIGGLLLAAGVAAAAPAPGCPAALARAAELGDADLAALAPALARAIHDQDAPAPADALLGEALRAADDRGAAAGARFRAALARHCALAAAPRLPAAGAADRARAEEILERPAFRRARVDRWAVRRWLLGLWERILALFETREAQQYARFGQLLFLASAAAAALLGAWAVLRRRPGGARSVPSAEEAVPSAPDARLDDAEAAAARGDAARAVRLSMLAALGALERDGAVPPGRTFTGAELVAHLRAASGARRAAAEQLCAIFDRTVYGARAAGAAEAEAALAAARTLGSGPGVARP